MVFSFPKIGSNIFLKSQLLKSQNFDEIMFFSAGSHEGAYASHLQIKSRRENGENLMDFWGSWQVLKNPVY